MDAIKIIGLTKKYKDVTAVDNLSLTVKEGELFSQEFFGVFTFDAKTFGKVVSDIGPSVPEKSVIYSSIFIY